LWAYWYYAIVQHYGPGTHLLDVTHALDVALWFALHEATTDKLINTRFVNTDPANPGPTIPDWNSLAGEILIAKIWDIGKVATQDSSTIPRPPRDKQGMEANRMD
jgi:hypothetical protein